MRQIVPAVQFLALALGDEAPAVVRRLALGAGLLLTVAVLLLRSW